MKLIDQEYISQTVALFESAAISRDKWHHAEHLIIALHYVLLHDETTAAEKMRSGIFALLESFGIDLDKEMPYHETLTVFWIKKVAAFVKENAELPMPEMADKMISALDKDLPLRYYSRELLFSDAARRRFVSADLVTDFSL